MNFMVCEIGVTAAAATVGEIVVVPFTMTDGVASADVW